MGKKLIFSEATPEKKVVVQKQHSELIPSTINAFRYDITERVSRMKNTKPRTDTQHAEVSLSEKDNLIAEFCDITGAQSIDARSFLGALSWNMDIALNQFFELNGDATKLQSSNNQQSNSSLSAIFEFCSITGADESAAETFLNAFSWDIHIAMNRFFELNGDASKLMTQSTEQVDIDAITGSPNTFCFCKGPLQRDDGVKGSEGDVCQSCFNPIRETLYSCSKGQACCYEQIAAQSYTICSECYNLSNEDSPENVTETNSNEFVCKKVGISLTKIS